MGKKLVSLISIVTIAVMLLSASVVAPQAAARGVADMSIFKASKFDAHYRVPNEGSIQNMLKEEFVTLPGASAEMKSQAVQKFVDEFSARNPDTPSPIKLQALLKNELKGASSSKGFDSAQAVVTDRSLKSLVTLVEFPNTHTWTSHTNAAGECVDTEVTFTGPLHNEMEAPGPRDNNTVFYNDTSPELYEEIYFGEGPDAGVTVNHPNLGDIFFKGKTMVNYYLEQSGGKFAPSGEVYPQWFQAEFPEAYYGEDSCAGSHNIRAQALVMEVLDQLQADTDFVWQDFDGNGDGVVDNFTVIHAGAGQEGGGGAQGNFAIWSHASMLGMDGVKVCTAPATGCPDRDIFVREYSMDPEMVDLGVIAEEFGHAAFGLPDIYTTDAQGSPSNWAIMESGSWNGLIGGMEPAPFPLWFRYVIGWANIKEMDFDDPAASTKVGQLSKTPKGTFEGLKINLPDKEVVVPNPLNTGNAIWSNKGDLLVNTITQTFDLTGTTAPVLSFASAWNIETDWDYGYVEASTDGGTTWTLLHDQEGKMTDADPNEQNEGWGLTGVGTGTLSFDLSAYNTGPVTIRFRYWTDMATQGEGWWIDDVSVDDGATNLYSDDFEDGLGDWDTVTWQLVPYGSTYARYYLVEWRNNSGYDQGLKYAYATVYSDETQWEVDRGPYTVPGMLVWLRDTSYTFDYTLNDSTFDAPSYGPKHALLVVDSHFWPYEWDNWVYSGSGAHIRLNSRLQPGDATFTLQPTTPFSIRLGFDPWTGEYMDEPLDEQTFGPRPAVSQFHDSLGYYPGMWVNWETGNLYFWDRVASLTVPAQDSYTTKLTWMDKSPAVLYYGINLGDTILGSGNPGDEGVQYGLHIAVSSKAGNGSSAVIKTWNAPALTEVSFKPSVNPVMTGGKLVMQVKVKNTTPVSQNVKVNVPIPAKTRYLSGSNYRYYTNSIYWAGKIPAGATKTLTFSVKVFPGLPVGTPIVVNASVADDALGSTGTTTVLTK